MGKVVRANRREFETDDGSVRPFVPFLNCTISLGEVQSSYDRACNAIKSVQDAGHNYENTQRVGLKGKNKNRKINRRA